MANTTRKSRVACILSLAAVLGTLALGVLAAAPSLAAQAAAPPGMTIGPINDLNPDMPAAGRTPSYCLVTGSVVTNPSTGKTANFGLALPPTWNHKFLFSGCGGYCGVVFQSPPDDTRGGGFPHDALAKEYAIAATDDGHASTKPVLIRSPWR